MTAASQHHPRPRASAPPDRIKGHYHLQYGEFWFIMEGQISYLIEGMDYFVADRAISSTPRPDAPPSPVRRLGHVDAHRHQLGILMARTCSTERVRCGPRRAAALRERRGE
jgi:hypothetical protein